MKILSLESNNDTFEYLLKKDILIPCWLYKIVIETSKKRELNFIEETILKLIKEEPALREDIEQLSSILGLDNKKDLIKLFLRKINDNRLSESLNENENKEDATEFVVYQLYQEVYTSEMLPIITKDINSIVEVKNSFYNKEMNAQEVHFKKEISDNKPTKAFYIDQFEKRYNKPNQNDILKTIHLHNRDYGESFKIDYKNFNLNMIDNPELVYIHTKLYIPTSDINHVILTNGFTNNFSSLFSKIFKNNHLELIQSFKKGLKSDYDTNQKKQLPIPFTNDIKKYPKIIELIKSIEKDTEKIQNINSKSKEVKNSSLVIVKIYDTFEELFSILAQGIKDNKILQNKKLLERTAKDIGFNIYEKSNIPILNVYTSNNLQKYLAKCLISRKNELYEIASINPNYLYNLTKLFNIRNSIKHGDEKFDIGKISIQDIVKSKKLLYKTIEVLLKVKYEKIHININEYEDYEDIHKNNAQINLEEELSIDVMSKLSQELKDNLVSISFYLNDDNFITNKYISVTETCNLLAATFEQIVRNIINTLYLNDNNSLITKDEVLKKIKEKVVIGINLSTVQDNTIKNALKKQSGSLGSYMLIYIYYNDNVEQKDVDLIETVLKLRKHGNPSIEEVQNISLEELKLVKSDSLKYIKKLMKEV